jgi:NADH dehydrogenase
MNKAIVTGASGYTGKYITRRLLAAGTKVRTLTGHPGRPHEFGDRIEISPLQFSDRRALVESLRGADCLFNTYWIRFSHGARTFEEAVANTKILFEAARDAGVQKIVHVSITNPSLDSPLPYFRGKAGLEAALRASGVGYAILRPTVIFGFEDILVNNIGWLLRRLPLFAIPGRGDYPLQPIFVEDVAELAVRAAGERTSSIVDAVGPEIFSFKDFVRLIAAETRSNARMIHVPPSAALFLSSLLGAAVGDRILTRDEVSGLMAGLLVSAAPPTGTTRFSEWLRDHASALGMAYASELARHYA